MERTAPGGRGEEERAMVKMERNGEEMVIEVMRWQAGHVEGAWGTMGRGGPDEPPWYMTLNGVVHVDGRAER